MRNGVSMLGLGRWRNARVALLASFVIALLMCPVASADPLGQITELPRNVVEYDHPNGITAGPDGNLWFVDDEFSWFARVTPGYASGVTETMDYCGNGPATLGAATSIAAGPTGALWLIDNGPDKGIGEITFGGYRMWGGQEMLQNQGCIAEFSQGLQPGQPLGSITPGPDGNMWFTSQGKTPAIGQITPAGAIQEFDLPLGSDPSDSYPPDSKPVGIAAGPDGNLWFTDQSSSGPAIGRIGTDGSLLQSFTLPPGSNPVGITEGPDGNMWVTDNGSTPRIGRITSNGTITWFALPTGSSPNQITPGPDGNLWFTDDGSTPAIGQITPDGAITEFSEGLQSGNGSHPLGIAAGRDGNMWFTDPGAAPDIGYIGTGAPPATTAAPTIVGSHQEDSQQSCQGAGWSTWDGQQPHIDGYAFDGYQWLRNGTPIAGATSASYTPVADDVGQQLQCVITATYSVVQTSAPAFSQQVTVQPRIRSGGGTTGSNGAGSGSGTTANKPPAKLRLITCRPTKVTVTRHGKKARVTREQCKSKLVAASTKLKMARADHRTTLTRHRVTYAIGYAHRTKAGVQAALIAARSLPKGSYTLNIVTRHGRKRTVSHQQVKVV